MQRETQRHDGAVKASFVVLAFQRKYQRKLRKGQIDVTILPQFYNKHGEIRSRSWKFIIILVVIVRARMAKRQKTLRGADNGKIRERFTRCRLLIHADDRSANGDGKGNTLSGSKPTNAKLSFISANRDDDRSPDKNSRGFAHEAKESSDGNLRRTNRGRFF